MGSAKVKVGASFEETQKMENALNTKQCDRWFCSNWKQPLVPLRNFLLEKKKMPETILMNTDWSDTLGGMLVDCQRGT